MLSWTRHLFRPKRAVELPPEPPAGSSASLAEPPVVGTLLCDRYRLESIVGRGGSSVVYRGRDELLGAEIAVKVLCGQRERGRTGEIDVRAEADAVARLSHPHIARVHSYARHDPWQLLVMEYLAGEDLHTAAKRRPGRRFALADLLRISVRCLDALAHAHAAGVVHNDIKPSNIVLTRAGTLKLCDFGLSHLAGDSTGPWLKAASAGSHVFMSPERILGEPSDGRSDLYSLAATLYTLGTGHTLFGTELAQAWRGHLELRPPVPQKLPRPIFRVLEVALEKNKDDRFASAEEMKAALIDGFRALRASDPRREPSRPVKKGARASGAARATSARSTPAARPKTPVRSPAPLRESQAPEPELEAPPVDAPRAKLRVARPEGLVFVEPLTLTSRHGGEHDVPGFWVMRVPVTNADYQRFVEEAGVVPPAHWIGGQPPVDKRNHPVVGVSLEHARAYARWRGMRLPSDVEWEAAARGSEGRAFPWGEAFDASRCNGPERGAQGTTPVDEHASGASAAGCLDLVGNVWEWSDPERCVHEAEPGYAWVFGGSFRHPCEQDGGIPRTQVAASKEYLYLGFRCVFDDRSEQ